MIANKMIVNESALKRVCQILKEIPWDEWEKAIKTEPEWQTTQVLPKKYPQNVFITFMVMAG
ncbi:MAG: hypothetical protein LWW94_10725 [Candidatus Desulfofervidaceae bacterium]|nr:hypothetical protein [Candidatus Desulfofervidaceae bacterium]